MSDYPTSRRDVIELVPIGHVESQLVDLSAAPRQPDEGAPGAVLVLDAALRAGLDGLAAGDEVVVLTWLHAARRDELTTRPRSDPSRPLQGVFSTRAPDRPNPIGLHETTIVRIDDTRITVDHFEAIDRTPIVDLKPLLAAPAQR